MAVVFKVPFIVKVIFPVIFLIEWVRRWLHKEIIDKEGIKYLVACDELYQPFIKEIRDYLEELGKREQRRPIVVEFGCGPYPALEVLPSNAHFICVDPCPDFNEQFNAKWLDSHLKT